MITYVFRRIAYAFLILIGVNLLTFMLFFKVNSPDDVARMQLGGKHIKTEDIERWKAANGYDKPLFLNTQKSGIEQLTNTLFFERSLQMFVGDFGSTNNGRSINRDIKERAVPSTLIALPTFIIGTLTAITWALLMAFFHKRRFDFWSIVLCVTLISIPSMFYIIGGQYLFAKILNLAPISGFNLSLDGWRFVWLPIVLGVIMGVSGRARWYRSLFLEEINKDYVRTARAKGLPESIVLGRHVLRNAAIPLATTLVAVIPSLFLGSLLMESFFAIPGLGGYMIEAIKAQDFNIVRAIVFIGSAVYILGLILTDLAYAWLDPRIRLE